MTLACVRPLYSLRVCVRFTASACVRACDSCMCTCVLLSACVRARDPCVCACVSPLRVYIHVTLACGRAHYFHVRACVQEHPLRLEVQLMDSATQRHPQSQVSFTCLPLMRTMFVAGATETDSAILGSIVAGDGGASWPSEAALHLLGGGGEEIGEEQRGRPYRCVCPSVLGGVRCAGVWAWAWARVRVGVGECEALQLSMYPTARIVG